LNRFAIVFDLDGTLVNSLPDICGNVNRVREHLGLVAWDPARIRPHIGRGVEYLLSGALPESPAVDRPRLIDLFRAFYMETPALGGATYPGVRLALERIRSSPAVALGIATNKHTRVAERTLEHYLPGLAFDAVCGADSVSRKKPDPAHLLETLGRLGVAPARACFVGDDPVDLACARAAGVTFYAAAYGFGGVEADAEGRLESFGELFAKLPVELGLPRGV